jgi:hypothetical protein
MYADMTTEVLEVVRKTGWAAIEAPYLWCCCVKTKPHLQGYGNGCFAPLEAREL